MTTTKQPKSGELKTYDLKIDDDTSDYQDENLTPNQLRNRYVKILLEERESKTIQGINGPTSLVSTTKLEIPKLLSMSKILSEWCNKMEKKNFKNYDLYYNGYKIQENDTARALQLRKDDIIYAIADKSRKK
ncbi:hypothetical protein KGF54_005511 [Candida jiufengensis]|uniref:uncharacterized protein n=1 Tax=Candida jiufengensis TaxID=497108 RepID=UPI002224CDAC|nr:uncharacterized protein KGF54_005511 [Candida jiufengensis]KAI5949276.1 hypothetical protein KGF54_005511 [Candida jiufengensis]